MVKSKKWAAALILGLAARAALAAEPVQPASNQELQDRIAKLQAQVDQLQGNQQKYDSRDVDATVAAVLKDANAHTLLIDGTGVTAGGNIKKGFFISSEDGSFYLHPRLTLQFRGVADTQEKGKNGGSDSKNGFEIRRAKFGFDGNVLTKDLSFRFQWQDANNGGTPTLEYAWVQYVLTHNFAGGDFAVRGGQYKNIVFKEETTGDEQQLMVERSLANTLIGGGTLGPLTQGVDFIYTGDNNPLHAQFLLHDAGLGNNDFQDNFTTTSGTPPVTTVTHGDFGVAGRVDYKVFGDWSAADDLTGVWGKNNLLVIGAGADFTESDHTNAVRYTVDAQYQATKQFVLFGALYGDYLDFRNTTGPTNRKDYGGQIEAGYFLNPAWELVARYSITKTDKNFKVATVDRFHEIAAGVNYFLGDQGSAGNRAKISVDLNYLPNGSPAALGNDFRALTAKRDEIVLRAQFQLWL